MIFALKKKHAGKGACSKNIHKGKLLVNNSSYFGEKKNFSMKDYVLWYNKGHIILKAAGKVMMTKRKVDAFLASIKYHQIKDSGTTTRSKTQFVDDYHKTAQFIKEEACHVHKVYAKDCQPRNVTGLKSSSGNGSGRKGRAHNHGRRRCGGRGNGRGGRGRNIRLWQNYFSEEWRSLRDKKKTQICKDQKKVEDSKWNTLSLTRSNLSEVTKMTALDVTEYDIAAMSCKDNNAAGDDNNEAESSFSSRNIMKKRTKRWCGVKGVTQ